jgi:hypothetical protein
MIITKEVKVKVKGNSYMKLNLTINIFSKVFELINLDLESLNLKPN